MIIPESYEALAQYVKKGKTVFFFTATWCGDCNYIKPQMPEIEKEFSDYQFVLVDRDKFLDLAVKWSILGIPSFVVYDEGKEIGRLVNKKRKTKEEIETFLNSL